MTATGKQATTRRQRQVDAQFAAETQYWTDIYQQGDVSSIIYQQRRAAAMAWADELALPTGARVLEVGCGAGLAAVALAQRGLVVDAMDSASAMIRRAHQHAAEAGVGAKLRASQGDVHALHFQDGVFGLVIALGVVPWLHSPHTALQEMARVLSPGGYVLVSADNRLGLNCLVDPLYSPTLMASPIRRTAKNLLIQLGLRPPVSEHAINVFHSLDEFDELLSSVGLEKWRARTLGFGPFTLLRRRLLPDWAGVALHRRLQRLADQGVSGLSSTGAHYIVLAQKPVG